METTVGETLGSTSVKMLLDMLVYDEFVDNFRSMKLDVLLLEKLKKTLEIAQVELHDDENKWFSNLAANEWFDTLRYAFLQVETLFDEINTEALRCKVKAEYKTPTTITIDQVRNIFSSRSNQFHRVINSKLKKLIQTLYRLLSQRRDGYLGFSYSSLVWRRTPTTSVLVDHESSIYGRDSDIKKLKHLLLSSDGDDDCKTRVISIVGMVGIGKTALAKLIYNDPQVDDNFELKVWVYISKDFDISRIFKTILESITSQTITSDNLNSQPLESLNIKRNDTSDRKILLVTLQQILSTTNFLLVLDDVWDAKSVDWIYMMNIFNAGKTGSRIIITTRDERVALSMQTFLSIHYLRPLGSEDCWSIVVTYAFGACSDQQRSNLEEISREIAKKCDGLPLAAVEFGALLHGKLSLYEWNCVLKRNIWESANPALESSYHYLSTALKQCFEYCYNFPKKSILEKKMVVQLWIAEGFVQSFTSEESLEKVGEEYFDVLVSRSLIQRRSIGDEEADFEMHNLFHELATMVSFPYFFEVDEYNLHERVHSLPYNRRLYDLFTKSDKLYGVKSLHTFLALPLQKQLPFCLLSNKVVHDLLPTMKQSRVLSLSNYRSITKVPNSIGKLLHLRYLNLSHTEIERLPSETCKLYNLQFLLLAGCRRLIELPEDVGKLVNLRHLDVSDTALSEMPLQIAKLENLHTLSDFVVSKHNDGLKLADLGKFPHLNGKLSISQLQNVNDPFEADRANMKMKEWIDELALEWDCGSSFPDSQIKSVVLEHLQPSTNLKSLTIKGCGGISFPNWLGDFSFSNMMYLKISNCVDCLWLPPLGQLGNLKELIIEGMQSVQTIGTEFYGNDSSSFQPFPSLETLHFEDMQQWEEWSLIGGTATKFPSLKTLSLSKCPRLRVGKIHEKLPSLTELELRECPLLVQSVPSSGHVFRQLMFPLNFLRQLTIDGSPSLMSFPTDGLPKTLKSLIVSNCENLEFFPNEYLLNYTSLEELKISYSCNSMMSFTLGALPVLKSLFIEGCKNLKSISVAEGASETSLSFLKSIKIWDCNELVSFPPGGLPTLNLVYIAVWKCEKLHSIPEAMNTLTNLQEMEIDDLPNLQSLVIDDLPTSLQELAVGSVGGIIWNTVPTWKHLTCLSVLRINGNDTVNTLMIPLLPASLVTLCICGLNDKSIDGKWFRHLTSLQNLEIVNALKLKSLPKQGLPSSLSVLNITRCPLLVLKLRRTQGNEWRKIAHIPAIIIDGYEWIKQASCLELNLVSPLIVPNPAVERSQIHMHELQSKQVHVVLMRNR